MYQRNKACMIDIGGYLSLLKSSAPLLNNKPIDDQQAFDIFKAVHDEAFSSFFKWSNKLYFLYNELANIYGSENVYTGNIQANDGQVSDWVDNYDTAVCDPIVMDLIKVLTHYFPDVNDKLKECKFDVMGNAIQYILIDNQLADPGKDKQYIQVGDVFFNGNLMGNDITSDNSKVIVGNQVFDHNAWRKGILATQAHHTTQQPEVAIVSSKTVAFDTTILKGSDVDTVASINGLLHSLFTQNIRSLKLIVKAGSHEAYAKYRAMVSMCNEHFGMDISFSFEEKKVWGEEIRQVMEMVSKQIVTQRVNASAVTVTAKSIEALYEIRDRILKRKKVTDFDQKSIMSAAPGVFKTNVDLNTFLHRLQSDRNYFYNNSVLSGVSPQVFNQNELVLLLAIDEYIIANETDARTLNYLS